MSGQKKVDSVGERLLEDSTEDSKNQNHSRKRSMKESII